MLLRASFITVPENYRDLNSESRDNFERENNIILLCSHNLPLCSSLDGIIGHYWWGVRVSQAGPSSKDWLKLVHAMQINNRRYFHLSPKIGMNLKMMGREVLYDLR